MSTLKTGLDVSLSAAGVPGVGSVVEFFQKLMDPGRRAMLGAMIEEYVLSELPRIHRLLEERASDLAASACTPLEAQVIAHQTIEAQKRTLDDEKRRHLTNVLVNGLCAKEWDKAKLRLLIRLTSELEAEHIEVLKFYAEDSLVRTQRLIAESQQEQEARGRRVHVTNGLTRELIARGLLTETTYPRTKQQRLDEVGQQPAIIKLDLETKILISPLGHDLLDYLHDPDGE